MILWRCQRSGDKKVQGGCKDTGGGQGKEGLQHQGDHKGYEGHKRGAKGGRYLLFLPMMPPRMQRGMVTRAQMTRITTMVPKGKACVDCSNIHKGSSGHYCQIMR